MQEQHQQVKLCIGARAGAPTAATTAATLAAREGMGRPGATTSTTDTGSLYKRNMPRSYRVQSQAGLAVAKVDVSGVCIAVSVAFISLVVVVVCLPFYNLLNLAFKFLFLWLFLY